jgi:uncharacterized protein Smg (DUF494 family)
MTEPTGHDGVFKLLKLLGDKLAEHLEGDDLALETLGEAIEEGGFTGDDLASVIAAIRSLSSAETSAGWLAGSPGALTARVLSAEERESLSTEAWGYLLDLRVQGTLDSEQFERVIDLLTGSGIRPVSVELARDVASRIALEHGEGGNPGDAPHGDIEVAH